MYESKFQNQDGAKEPCVFESTVYKNINTTGDTQQNNNEYFCVQLHIIAINGDKLSLQKWLNAKPEEVEVRDQMGRTPLTYAVLGERPDCVEALIKAGASVNTVDSSGRTALHWASHKGNIQCTKFLLTKGGKWNIKDANGMTPLHLSARNRSHRGLHLILKYLMIGEIDDQDNFKRTALHWSALFGNAEHIRLLVKHDANIGIPDIEGKTALHWAASCKLPSAVQCVQILLDHAPNVINWQDYEGRSALHLAIADGTKAVVEILTSIEKCNMNSMDNTFQTPLHWAAILGLADVVKLLLERKADPSSSDANGATPLHYAAQNNSVGAVDTFLSFPDVINEPDLKGRKALLWAAGRGADDVIRIMQKHSIDFTTCDKNGVGALHCAAMSGHVTTCTLLIQMGSDLESQDFLYHTPLFYACAMGHADVVQVLLDSSADVFWLDIEGKSALHWAAMGGHTYVCQILITHGLNPNYKDMCGRTALQGAAFGGHTDCISTLMENGAHHSVQDNEGMTALHWACSKGLITVVLTLLDYGAYPNHMAFTDERYTPLDLALLGEHYDVVQSMMEHGGMSINRIQTIAATAIQSYYRGYRVRKNFNEKRKLLVRHEQLRRKRAESDALRSNSVQSRDSLCHSLIQENEGSKCITKAHKIEENQSSSQMNKSPMPEINKEPLQTIFPKESICRTMIKKTKHVSDYLPADSTDTEFSPSFIGDSLSEESEEDENIFEHLEVRGIKLNRKRFPGHPHSTGEIPNKSEMSAEFLKSISHQIKSLVELQASQNGETNVIYYTIDSNTSIASNDSTIVDDVKKSHALILGNNLADDVQTAIPSVKYDKEKLKFEAKKKNGMKTESEQPKLSVERVKSSCLDMVSETRRSSALTMEKIKSLEVQKPRLGILRSLRKKLARQKEPSDFIMGNNCANKIEIKPNNQNPVKNLRLENLLELAGPFQHQRPNSHQSMSMIENPFQEVSNHPLENKLQNAARIIQCAWRRHRKTLQAGLTQDNSFKAEAQIAAEEIWSQCLATISL